MSKPIPDFDAGFQAGFGIMDSTGSMADKANDFFKMSLPASAFEFKSIDHYLPSPTGWNKATLVIGEIDRTGTISDDQLNDMHQEVTRIMSSFKTIG